MTHRQAQGPVPEAYDAVDIIRAQRDGRAITEGEIRWLVDAYTRGYVMDAQMSAFTMAVLLNGLGRDQIRVLTDAMIARPGACPSS